MTTILPVKTMDIQPWMTAPETQAVMRALNADAADPMALFVGGCVRNALLGQKVEDIDIATRLTPDEVSLRLTTVGLAVIPTGMDHGTVTAVCGQKSFEITTLRLDVETDGRRAIVAFTEDWRQDAARRDFTMNTLLADADGQVYDPTGEGLEDLERGIVRFVGDARRRIAEDYLRILRFFRFYGRFGRGAPDAEALAACEEAAGGIDSLSRERVTQEMLRILMLENPVDLLALMFGRGVLADVPSGRYDSGALRRLCERQERAALQNVAARLLVLSAGDLSHFEALCERHFILPRATIRQVHTIAHVLDEDLFPEARQRIYRFGRDAALQAILIEDAEPDYALLETLRVWQVPTLPVTGEDVMALGIEKGPVVGALMAQVETWWLSLLFQPGRDACLARLKLFSGVQI